jgi:hypothetical protein
VRETEVPGEKHRPVIRILSYIGQEFKFTLASLLPNFSHYWLS